MNNLRALASLASLAALATAHAGTNVYFGDSAGNAVTSLAAPAVGSTFTLSVWYSSTVEVIDGETFLGYGLTDTAGAGATPSSSLLVDLASTPAASVSAAPGILLTAPQRAGAGLGDPAGPRSYGLDLGTINSNFDLLPTAGTRLFDVTFKNLGLTAGKSQVLSFFTSPTASGYKTVFYDTNAVEVTPTGGSLTVSAAPVPEPTTLAAVGLGALAVLRRRKRA